MFERYTLNQSFGLPKSANIRVQKMLCMTSVCQKFLANVKNEVNKYGAFRGKTGGEGGIRTLDTLLTYTPLAGERFKPLSHLSNTLKL